MLNRGWALAAICLLCGAWGDDDEQVDDDRDDRGGGTCEWTQWGQSPSHDGQVCVAGQDNLRMLARLVVDKFAAQETAGTPVLRRAGGACSFRSAALSPRASSCPAACWTKTASR